MCLFSESLSVADLCNGVSGEGTFSNLGYLLNNSAFFLIRSKAIRTLSGTQTKHVSYLRVVQMELTPGLNNNVFILQGHPTSVGSFVRKN